MMDHRKYFPQLAFCSSRINSVVRDAVRKTGWMCLALLLAITSGCATNTYRYGRAENYHTSMELAAIQGDRVERGEPRPVIDGIGWVVGIPSKIILWDWRADNHAVSEQTEAKLVQYLEDNELDNVKVRVNQYAPGDEWKRLVANKSVGAGWRYTLGTLSWVGYTIFPGRVFGGDNYNPFTNTINVYSDLPAVVLHEGGHAKDFSSRHLPGTYAALYTLVPLAPLYHEAIATNDALSYVHTEGSVAEEREAYRLLYPAYGTYVGSAFGGTVVAVVGGHVVGRLKGTQLERERAADQEQIDQVREQHALRMSSRLQMDLESPQNRGAYGPGDQDGQTLISEQKISPSKRSGAPQHRVRPAVGPADGSANESAEEVRHVGYSAAEQYP